MNAPIGPPVGEDVVLVCEFGLMKVRWGCRVRFLGSVRVQVQGRGMVDFDRVELG